MATQGFEQFQPSWQAGIKRFNRAPRAARIRPIPESYSNSTTRQYPRAPYLTIVTDWRNESENPPIGAKRTSPTVT